MLYNIIQIKPVLFYKWKLKYLVKFLSKIFNFLVKNSKQNSSIIFHEQFCFNNRVQEHNLCGAGYQQSF